MLYIETDRLILRNYRETDVADFHAYMKLPYTAEHEDFEPLTYAESERWVAGRLHDDAACAVEMKANGTMIGDLCYRAREYDTYEIGHDFNVQYGGQGYATEACAALIAHIFQALGGRRIVAECNEGNERSWKLLERLSFRREGHAIEDVAFKQDAAGNPIYINSYQYALLRREWRA